MYKTMTFIIVLLSLFATGCAWVKPSVDSQKVMLSTKGEVAKLNCAKKGFTTSKTMSKFWFIPRSKNKVFTELVTLAKNEAVILGGDTVVPESLSVKGLQTFAIYKCR